MMRILLSLLTIFMILVSFSHEAHEIKLSGDSVVKVEHSQSLDIPDHCDDHESGPDHCHIHCSGLHFLATLEHSVALKLPLIKTNDLIILRRDFFKSPFLDPAKKPPSFS